MFKISYKTINHKKVACSILTKDGYKLDLESKHEKGSLEKMNKNLIKKHKKGHDKFYALRGTCPCCLREFNINKVTGKLSNHYMGNDYIKCLGASLEPLEISDEGLTNTIKIYIALFDTYKMISRKSHKWSTARKENNQKAEQVKAILIEKINLLISYRDLAKIRRKEEEKAAKKAKRAAEKAAKKAKRAAEKAALAAEKKTEKYLIRQAYFANRCNGTFCPKCNKVAESKEEVEMLFGFRKKKDGTLHPQSNCKRCRSLANKASRAKKKARLNEAYKNAS